jgi:quercetin dioxygenase-like cupin family protein
MSHAKIDQHAKTPRLFHGAMAGLAIAALVLASDVVAQPAGETGRIPQFENDQVKVWKSIVQPHSPLPLHRHEHPRVIIALVGGTMKIVEQNGPMETHDWRSGNAYWLPANAPGTMHQDVNAGDKPIEVMVVELKTAK